MGNMTTLGIQIKVWHSLLVRVKDECVKGRGEALTCVGKSKRYEYEGKEGKEI